MQTWISGDQSLSRHNALPHRRPGDSEHAAVSRCCLWRAGRRTKEAHIQAAFRLVKAERLPSLQRVVGAVPPRRGAVPPPSVPHQWRAAVGGSSNRSPAPEQDSANGCTSQGRPQGSSGGERSPDVDSGAVRADRCARQLAPVACAGIFQGHPGRVNGLVAASPPKTPRPADRLPGDSRLTSPPRRPA
jgi:hypothetical protein